MKPGTIVRLPDGREGTVVYHGLIGYGIRWGRIDIDIDSILAGDGNTMQSGKPAGFQFEPEAMLRKDCLSLEIECVGEEYEIIE